MTAAMPARPGSGGSMSIGEVLGHLRPDFPDISISKIRFLESEGLVQPGRAPSGYRKFSYADLDQLRYVLTAQRDHYLPLKVIKEHLDAISRGLEPPAAAGEAPRAPRQMHAVPAEQESGAAPDIRMSRTELLANSGLSAEQLTELEGFGLLAPRPGTEYFDSDALAVASTIAELAEFGLEPRHLRAFKTAADREVGLIDQVISPVAQQRDQDAKSRAEEMTNELGQLSVRLHSTLVAAGLKKLLR